MLSGEVNGEIVEHGSYYMAICDTCGKLPYLTNWSINRAANDECGKHNVTMYSWYNGQWNEQPPKKKNTWTQYRDMRIGGYSDLG